jgi:hypothetical protein
MQYLTKDTYIVIICLIFYTYLNGIFVIIAPGVLAGAMTITSLSAIQEASAAKDCTTDANSCYCYSNLLGGKICFGNKGKCQKVQREDQLAASGCFRQNQ